MSERKIAEQVGAERMQVRRYIAGKKLKGKD
jgi:predicted transcriptional regulator